MVNPLRRLLITVLLLAPSIGLTQALQFEQWEITFREDDPLLEGIQRSIDSAREARDYARRYNANLEESNQLGAEAEGALRGQARWVSDGERPWEIANRWTMDEFASACEGILELVAPRYLAAAQEERYQVRRKELAHEIVALPANDWHRFEDIDADETVFNREDLSSGTNYEPRWGVRTRYGYCNVRYEGQDGLVIGFSIPFEFVGGMREQVFPGGEPPPVASVDAGSSETTGPTLISRGAYQQVEPPPSNEREVFVAIPLPEAPRPTPCPPGTVNCVAVEGAPMTEAARRELEAWQAAVAEVNRRNEAERQRVEAVNAERQRAYDAWSAREQERRRAHEQGQNAPDE